MTFFKRLFRLFITLLVEIANVDQFNLTGEKRNSLIIFLNSGQEIKV